MLMQRLGFFVGAALILVGCGSPAATQESLAPTLISPTAAPPQPTATRDPSEPVPTGTIVDNSYAMEVVHRSGFKVNGMAIGSKGELLAIDFLGDTVYQFLEDGSLQVYAKFPGMRIVFFGIAPDGALWFANVDGVLYRIREDGQPERIAANVNRHFAFDSAGNIYAVDPGGSTLQKITPEGKVEVIASGFQAYLVAVGPGDTIVMNTYEGKLMRVEGDGTLTLIASGFSAEHIPVFDPDGNLYLMSFYGISTVDLASKEVQQLKWYNRYSNTGAFLIFDQDGYAYTYHPNQAVYRLDMKAQTSTLFYHPRGNTRVMGVDPTTETLYVAYGDGLPGGETTLYRVEKAVGGLVEIGSVPYGIEESFTFAPNGMGYLSVTDMDGRMIYQFDPAQGIFAEYYRPKCVAHGLAVDPTTGLLWWSSCDLVETYSKEEGYRQIPFLPNINTAYLAFSEDGSMYALIWFRKPEPAKPARHGIFRFESNKWIEIKDLTAKDPTITLATLAMCPDGYLYIAGSFDDIIPRRGYSTMSSLWRLEEDNTLTLLGYDLGGFDNSAMTCSPNNNIYFTTADGVYVVKPVTKTTLQTTATPPKPTSTAGPSAEPTISPLELAEAGATSNGEWMPFIQEFDGVRMALVPAGCFMMGSTEEEIQFTLQYCLSLFGESRCKYDYFAREKPLHEVCFGEPYWIDVTEVTNAQYGSPGTMETPDHPRDNVNWFEATAYCARRGTRLPTEAEWEYAARGPDGLYFPWGNKPEEAGFNFCDANCDLDWALEAINDGYQYTAPVGAYPDNASWIGVMDLIGNVKEWVSSLYREYPYDAEDGREAGWEVDRTNPRVLRGGGWDNFTAVTRAAFRIGLDPAQISQWDGIGATGFRCARSYAGE